MAGAATPPTALKSGTPTSARRLSLRAAQLLAAAALALGLGAPGASATLYWQRPALVDSADSSGGLGRGVRAVSCPSENLCVAGDLGANMLTTTNPGAGPGAWTIAHFTDSAVTTGFTAVDCPSVSECVAFAGSTVLHSTNPTGGPGAWTITQNDPDVFSGVYFQSVSCPTVSLCVAVDHVGDVLTSTDPDGAASDWKLTELGGTREEGYPFEAVSCPSVSLCVAVDDRGNITSTTNPTGGAGAWSTASVFPRPAPYQAFSAVSCPTVSLCVAVSTDGRAWSATDPTGGPSAWKPVGAVHDALMSISCPTTRLCAGGGAFGNIATSTDPSGQAWSSAALDGGTEPDGSQWIGAISCPTESLCIAFDNGARAIVGQSSPLVPWINASALGGTFAPSTLGLAALGQRLYAVHGGWVNAPSSYRDQWQRCDRQGNSCAPIPGAGAVSYPPVPADVGHTIRLNETAYNAAGQSAPSASAPAGPVTSPAAPGGSPTAKKPPARHSPFTAVHIFSKGHRISGRLRSARAHVRVGVYIRARHSWKLVARVRTGHGGYFSCKLPSRYRGKVLLVAPGGQTVLSVR